MHWHFRQVITFERELAARLELHHRLEQRDSRFRALALIGLRQLDDLRQKIIYRNVPPPSPYLVKVSRSSGCRKQSRIRASKSGVMVVISLPVLDATHTSANCSKTSCHRGPSWRLLWSKLFTMSFLSQDKLRPERLVTRQVRGSIN